MAKDKQTKDLIDLLSKNDPSVEKPLDLTKGFCVNHLDQIICEECGITAFTCSKLKNYAICPFTLEDISMIPHMFKPNEYLAILPSCPFFELSISLRDLVHIGYVFNKKGYTLLESNKEYILIKNED
jgi:hypothetical protein